MLHLLHACSSGQAVAHMCVARMQGGKEPNSNDCKLGPQLKHVIIGSKTIKVGDVKAASF